MKENIKATDILVATYNGDPFNVEGDNIKDVEETLDKGYDMKVFTKDDEDFDTLACRLDFFDENDRPKAIYMIGEGMPDQLTFALYEDYHH